MMGRWKDDILAQTGAVAIVFCWFLLGTNLKSLGAAFLVSVVAAIVGRLKPALVVTCLLFPIIPILVSHLLVEPFLSGAPWSASAAYKALSAWMRVGGMALLSVVWLTSLNVRSAAQLCSLTGAGQYLMLPFLIAGTFIAVVRDRWFAIRELQALRTRGLLRKRIRIRFAQVPGVGLQLTMASLVSSGELALASSGRGIGARRFLAVAPPEPSAVGLGLILVLAAATVMLALTGAL